MYLDAHTHLNSDQLFPERKKSAAIFEKAWGVALVNIWADDNYNKRAIEIAKASVNDFPNLTIKATIWLHPYEISVWNITHHNKKQKINELYSLYSPTTKNHIAAIGEVGIDTYFPWSEKTLELQKELFWLQCQRAKKLWLPLVIHTRANRSATFEVLQNYKELTIYFHCWPYGPKEIKEIKKTFKNFYIGFCANISYPNASNIRKSLRYLVYETEDYPEHILKWKIPIIHSLDVREEKGKRNNFLLETDAPYLPFQDRRWKTQYPHEISKQYDYILRLFWHDITKATYTNFQRLYKTKIK